MIRVVCKGCGSQLNAKDELAGQKRKCPKCGNILVIPATPEPAAPSPPVADSAAQASEVVAPPGLSSAGIPRAPATSVENAVSAGDAAEHPHLVRLERHHRYVICDPTRLVAQWENDGRGWQFKSTTGLVNATRNRNLLPSQGDFRLAELKITTDDAGHHLTGIQVYRLARHYALANLAKGDDAITTAIVGPGGLNREQKLAVRQAIRAQFMPEVWGEAHQVLDYLANDDAQSPGT